MAAYTNGVKATLTDEQYKALMEYVKKEETSIAHIIRKAIKEFLEKHEED